MSDFKEIVDYLKFDRRSVEASLKNKNFIARKVEENYVQTEIYDENELIFVEKEAINNENGFLNISNEIIGNLYLLSQDNEHLYYVKYIDESTGISMFRKIPRHPSEPWVELEESLFDVVIIKEGGNFYYDLQNNIVIELSIEESYVFSDRFAYHPNDIPNSTDGVYSFNFKDEEGYTSNKSDLFLRALFSSNAQMLYAAIKRSVAFEKMEQPGLVHLLPKITTTNNTYKLSYNYYQKGIPFNKSLNDPALILNFKSFGAMAEFLNQTIFYTLDDIDEFKNEDQSTINGREALIEDYMNFINSQLRFTSGIHVLEILYYVPIFLFKAIDRNILWEILIALLDDSLTNAGINKEDIAVRIIKGLNESYENKNSFLGELIYKKTKNNSPLLEKLIYKVDGSNFDKIVKLLLTIWKESKYVSPSVETNPEFATTDGLLFLPYKSEKSFGFYFSNISMTMENINPKERLLKTVYETGRYNIVTKVHPKGGTYEEKKEIIEEFWYHPYYPIYLKGVENQESDLKLDSIVPAFMLKANQDKQFWSNVIKTGEYALDVLTTVSGVGNLAKFRYLSRLTQLAEAVEGASAVTKIARAANILRYIKGTAGVVEITGGSVNLMLKITELDQTKYGQALSKVLFYLELITLAGELTASMKLGLKKSAKEAVEASDGALRVKHPELFAELYKIVNISIESILKNKEFLKHFNDLKYGRVTRVFPNLLSLEEEAVLRFYTTNAGYKNFNKALRGEIEITDEFLAQEQLMNQALDKLPNYKTDALLYRIENLTDEQIKNYYKIGEEITNKHFTSTSYDQFSIGKAMKKRPYTVLIRIESKNGKIIEDLSTLKNEKEILFKSNTIFYVKDIKVTSNPSDWASEIKTIMLIEK